MSREKAGKGLLFGLMAGLFTGQVMAQDLTIHVTNLTHGSYFTPLLVAAHDGNTHLFTEGDPASTALQAMAEGGDLSGLVTNLQALAADIDENPAGGLLAPGAGVDLMLTTQAANTRLSLVAMILPTNDGFVGLDALELPTTPGTYRYWLNAYDAGTEVNDEIVNGGSTPGTPGIPADPGGQAGSGAGGMATSETNQRVHIHPGIVGDTDPAGGRSDLDPRVHRWLNPVAELTITVN